MSTADQHITDILAKYGEPFQGSIWRVQGQAVILHKALERIAARAGIWFDDPAVLRAEKDEAVILVKGFMGPEGKATPYAQQHVEWSIGEALIGVNYRVSGKQAAYVWAMAEKRGKDRVILKLIGLHGVVYSEEEADEMRDDIKRQRLASSQARRSSDKPRAETSRPAEEQATISVNGSVVDFPGQAAIDNNIEASVRKSIDSAETINAVTNVMLKPDTQRSLADLPQSVRDELRNYAKARLVALGWPEKKGA